MFDEDVTIMNEVTPNPGVSFGSYTPDQDRLVTGSKDYMATTMVHLLQIIAEWENILILRKGVEVKKVIQVERPVFSLTKVAWPTVTMTAPP